MTNYDETQRYNSFLGHQKIKELLKPLADITPVRYALQVSMKFFVVNLDYKNSGALAPPPNPNSQLTNLIRSVSEPPLRILHRSTNKIFENKFSENNKSKEQ